jgi:hypothetical protein
MIASYARKRIRAQAKAVAFSIVALAAAQAFSRSYRWDTAIPLAASLAAAVVGLAAFLEGLFLALMPLGERCGLALPRRSGPVGIAVFAAALGLCATLAEPAIGFLRELGGAASPWGDPLLYMLLGRGAWMLIGAIGVGVALAVALATLRLSRGWRLLPMLAATVAPTVALSALIEGDPALSGVAALAWDSGGMTTGPVTVPLVVALGAGLARRLGAADDEGAGLGAVALASILPVAAVLSLGALLAPGCPEPTSREDFFSPARRAEADWVTGSSEETRRLAAHALDDEAYARAFPGESRPMAEGAGRGDSWGWAGAAQAAQAVLPLALLLALALAFALKEKLTAKDELALGLALSVLGLYLFGAGVRHGLAELGESAGRSLPSAWTDEARPDLARTLRGVDERSIVRSAGGSGPRDYLVVEGDGGPELAPFDRTAWDPARGTYEFVPVDPAPLGTGPLAKYLAIGVFALLLGIGATLAEPSLAALGAKLEEASIGTFKRSSLVLTVALGVGVGMAIGFARVEADFPLWWVLAPTYLLALAMSAFVDERWVAIAWDCAGVTTGPVTVPLVIAFGLGLGSRSGAMDRFGAIAVASAVPVVVVLARGLYGRAKLHSAGGARR